MPRRSARCRAAAVAGTPTRPSRRAAADGTARSTNRRGRRRAAAGDDAVEVLGHDAAARAGAVDRRRSMSRSLASRLASGDAMILPPGAEAVPAAAAPVAGRAACAAAPASGAGDAEPDPADAGAALTVGEEPADQLAAGERLADLAESVQSSRSGGLHVGLGLVGLDAQDGGTRGHGLTVVGEPLGDRALLHREPELGHDELSRHGGPFVRGVPSGPSASSSTVVDASKRRSRAPIARVMSTSRSRGPGSFDRGGDDGVGRHGGGPLAVVREDAAAREFDRRRRRRAARPTPPRAWRTCRGRAARARAVPPGRAG